MTVWNIRDPKCPPDAVDVSRRGIGNGALGNPYTHSKGPTLAEYQVATREEAVAKHDVWFRAKMQSDPVFAALVESCRGKDMKCFCAPLSCHAHNYERYFEETS